MTQKAFILVTLLSVSSFFPGGMARQQPRKKHPDRQLESTRAANIDLGVSDSRFAKLRRGINTSHWFAQARQYTRSHLETHTTERDVALIKSLGFDHIRLSVEPAPMFNAGDPAALPEEYLAYLDRAIDVILAHDLGVVVDIHPSDDTDFKKRLASEDRHVEAFAKFWRSLARHLSVRDPERVFLEVINEPVIQDGYRWLGIQAKLIAAIREGAPLHTIIATGHRWSGLNQLLFEEPVADRNVVYNFHFYDPAVFTHQGATWGDPVWKYIKGVPYPSNQDAIAKMLPAIDREEALAPLRRYGDQRWDASRIEAEIGKAAAWAQTHKVRLTCNEFGVYRRFAPPADRAAWIRDVRTALEKYGIGWAMWDYQGGFSVVNKTGGSAVPDEETVSALGLRVTDDKALTHHTKKEQ